MASWQQPPYQQNPYGGQAPYPPQPAYDPDYDRMVERMRPRSKAPWLLLLLVSAGAGVGGYWLWTEREKLKAQVGVASEAERVRKTLEERVKTLEAEKAELVTARDALAKSVEEKSTELAELKGAQDKLQEQMKDEIARGDVQLTSSGGRLRVDLVDKILFESGDARISKRGEGVLLRVGAVLAGIEDKQIQVSGHTDDAPISSKLKAQYPTNWELSGARAVNVVRFLHEQAKVPPERLLASGHGEHQPVASNKSAKGRARNRRIEILLTPSLAPKAISRAKLKEQAAEPDKAEKAAAHASKRK